MAFSTKIKGHHHLQGNVQVYNVRMPDCGRGLTCVGIRVCCNVIFVVSTKPNSDLFVCPTPSFAPPTSSAPAGGHTLPVSPRERAWCAHAQTLRCRYQPEFDLPTDFGGRFWQVRVLFCGRTNAEEKHTHTPRLLVGHLFKKIRTSNHLS